jgi:hypothetical protein
LVVVGLGGFARASFLRRGQLLVVFPSSSRYLAKKKENNKTHTKHNRPRAGSRCRFGVRRVNALSGFLFFFWFGKTTKENKRKTQTK